MRRMPAIAALAPLMLVLQLWPGAASALRFLRPRFEQGAWWELLSAQLVHLSLAHALANAGALVLMAWLLRPWLGAAAQFAVLGGGAAGVALVLATDPGCRYYAGASGALHGWLAGGAVLLARLPTVRFRTPGRPAPDARHVAGWPWALLGLLLLKLALEAGDLWPSAWSFPVYLPAHVGGLLGGVLAALILRLFAARGLSARCPAQHQPD